MNFQLNQKTILSLLQLPILILSSWFLYMTMGSSIIALKIGAGAILFISVIQVFTSLLQSNFAKRSIRILLILEVVVFVGFVSFILFEEASGPKEIMEMGFLALSGLSYLIVLLIFANNSFPGASSVIRIEDTLLSEDD